MFAHTIQFEVVSRLSPLLFNSVYVMRQPDGIWLVGYNLSDYTQGYNNAINFLRANNYVPASCLAPRT